MGLSPFGNKPPMSDEERFKIIDRAIELGCIVTLIVLTSMVIMKIFLEDISNSIQKNVKKSVYN